MAPPTNVCLTFCQKFARVLLFYGCVGILYEDLDTDKLLVTQTLQAENKSRLAVLGFQEHPCSAVAGCGRCLLAHRLLTTRCTTAREELTTSHLADASITRTCTTTVASINLAAKTSWQQSSFSCNIIFCKIIRHYQYISGGTS